MCISHGGLNAQNHGLVEKFWNDPVSSPAVRAGAVNVRKLLSVTSVLATCSPLVHKTTC